MFVRFGLAGDDFGEEWVQSDDAAGVRVIHGGERGADAQVASEFFADFADEGGGGGFAGLDFASGKFPAAGLGFAGRSLGGEHTAIGPLDYRADDIEHGGEYFPDHLW